MVRLPLLAILLVLACYKRGELERKLNESVAHRDHVHIGMTKRGAAARTSFWSRGR